MYYILYKGPLAERMPLGGNPWLGLLLAAAAGVALSAAIQLTFIRCYLRPKLGAVSLGAEQGAGARVRRTSDARLLPEAQRGPAKEADEGAAELAEPVPLLEGGGGGRVSQIHDQAEQFEPQVRPEPALLARAEGHAWCLTILRAFADRPSTSSPTCRRAARSGGAA
jgi:hypothetical protein